MTFDEFMSEAVPRTKNRYGLRNAYVDEPEFESLYVRLSLRKIPCFDHLQWVIDIANITAKEPGKGSFKRLISRIRNKYPQFGIYVESVLNDRFARGLPHLGFLSVVNLMDHSFFLPPERTTADGIPRDQNRNEVL